MLDDAVSQAEAAAPSQLALYGLFPEEDDGRRDLPAARGPGRPSGSRNRRAEVYAETLRSRYGCPLAAATKVSALDITDERNILALARLWGCNRYQAAQL